ncbi:MAG TPA: copper homeostasis protein CutC [Gemmatimonadales bacterium]|nr:copper homeostasis protein CutC [Gemmatimonadales bacterium]HYT82134.1 copper homeostasis protein CutC [Gemmatimonadales bacterium]
MPVPILVEACVDSIESALAAAAGGAHRIELCANLVEGGTTPSAGTLAVCRAHLDIPIFVLVRPRRGDFLYSAAELTVMLEDIRHAKQAGAHGIVTGVLRADGRIDEDRTRELMAAARPLRVTFHRAFDVCRDATEALETLIALGVDGVLTSGQAATAPEGAKTIARLVRQAAGRIGILPGGGITADNVSALVGATGVTEVHLTGAVTRPSGMTFRAPEVVIGNAAPRSEYEWSVTDAERIRSVVRTLGVTFQPS